MNYRERKPCVCNMRISVYDVVGWLASGMTIDEIIHDYPELDDITACLAFTAGREHHLLSIRAA